MLHQNGTLCSTPQTSPTYDLNFLQLYLFNIKKNVIHDSAQILHLLGRLPNPSSHSLTQAETDVSPLCYRGNLCTALTPNLLPYVVTAYSLA